MDYRKTYKDFNILLKVDDDEKKKLWMQIETAPGRRGKYMSVSWFIYRPNFIDRLRGITWQDKIAAREKQLFQEIFKKLTEEENSELRAEAEKWYR